VDHEHDRRLDEIARRLSGPGWEKQRQFLSNPLLRSLALAVGVDVASIDDEQRDVRDAFAALILAAILFGPFGWTASARILKPSDYREAVALWRRNPDTVAVDDYLTRAWAEPRWFHQSYGPVTTLAGRHEPTLEVLLARNRLLDKAFDHHSQREYEASVLIVLSQIDGISRQFSETKHGLFSGAKPADFVDDSTFPGMPEVLLPVWRHVSQSSHGISLSGTFQRHAIMHGVELGFGTEVNSTKAFALLSGVIDWVRPRAAILTEGWQAAAEAK
jgi:hypothetical protein